MLVGRTLSVPWVRGHEWAGTPEELEEAWAAEVSRGCTTLHNVYQYFLGYIISLQHHAPL